MAEFVTDDAALALAAAMLREIAERLAPASAVGDAFERIAANLVGGDTDAPPEPPRLRLV